MSRLSFFCAVCGHSLTVGIEDAGKLAECPNCERLVPVPGWRPPPRAGAGCLGVLAPPLLAVDLKFLCLQCRSKLKVDARWGGTTLPCPKCGATVSVPHWHGDPAEIAEDVSRTVQNSPAIAAAPVVKLSAEELAFLGADQEVG